MKLTCRALALAAIVAGAAVAPPAQAATPFTFGMGGDPDMAVDAAGTGHVVWHDTSRPVGQDVVLYCRIPRGASECTGTQTLHTGRVGAKPHVFVSASNQVIVVLGEDQCGTPFCTLVRRSSDGGATFGPADSVADPAGSGSLTGPGPTGQAVYGPGDSISYVNGLATSGMFFTNAALGGGVETGFARLHEQSSAVDGSLGLDAGRPVAVYADQQDPRGLWWRAYDGSGDLNDAANWTPEQLVESGVPVISNDVSVAGGPSGLFVIHKVGSPGDNQYVVRKFTGSGWGPAVGVSERGDPIFVDLHQDASGRLHALWYANGPERLQWRTSADGVTWGPTITLHISEQVRPRLGAAAAADGQGFAFWDTGRGPNGALSELEATPLEPYTGPGSGISADDPCKWPTCLPAGGKTSGKVGGKKVTTVVSISSCGKKRVKVRVRKLKRRHGKVKVQKVVFKLGKAKRTDRRPPYAATFPLRGATLGKRYTLKATVHMRVGGRLKKLRLSKRFYACPLG